jgi:hypothetical protein
MKLTDPAELADLDELLPMIKTEYETRLGKPPDGDFPDKVLQYYAGEAIEGGQQTAGEVVTAAVDRAANRLEKRGEGRPHRDDPVGVRHHKTLIEAKRARRLEQMELAKAAVERDRDQARAEIEARRLELRAERDRKAAAVLRGEEPTP